MFELNVTPELLVLVVAGLLSFVFDYLPKVKDWWDAKQEHEKKQLMLIFVFTETVLIFAGVCYSVFTGNLTCDVPGAVELFGYFLVAIGVNQGVHRLTKPSLG